MKIPLAPYRDSILARSAVPPQEYACTTAGMQSMTTPRLVFGFREKDRAEIERLLREYETQLGVSLCFQAFDDELAGLPGLYVPPLGQFLTAWD
jgi:hypothetical protein